MLVEGKTIKAVGRNLSVGNATDIDARGKVVVKARFAADAVVGTKVDRPEWIVSHPTTREVYCACTNNAAWGREQNEGPNPVNRRAGNVMGHIVRWREAGDDPTATRFRWGLFVEAGDSAQPEPHKTGNIQGGILGSPDGLWVDPMGTLWVQTDMTTSLLNKGDHANFGNNQMLAVDPNTGMCRRFLTGPRGCEITGFHTTADNRTAFVNIQHTGEGWTARERCRAGPTTMRAAGPGRRRWSSAAGRGHHRHVGRKRPGGRPIAAMAASAQRSRG